MKEENNYNKKMCNLFIKELTSILKWINLL
jgi:hypothetical protein